MNLEKAINFPINIGRKTAIYIANDPVGDASIITGYKLAQHDSIALAIPFLVFGTWHLYHTFGIRKKIDREVKKFGLKERILKIPNESSWCSHWVAKVYAFEKKKYNEFKEMLNKHSYRYYAKRLKYNLKKEWKKIRKKLN